VRADRLLQIMLLLQARGRVTAGELAERLEVSVRTIQRDMDALSSAGLPVYALRGAQGGWAVVEGFRTTLTGLTPSDALAVAVGRADTVLSDLGLGGSEGALGKVLAAAPPLAREIAEHARQRIHVDLEPWTGGGQQSEQLRALHAAADADRVVSLRYGTDDRVRRLEPLGLVLKGNVWYLVAAAGERVGTYRVSRASDITVTDDTFERPEGFDLSSYWKRSRRDFVQNFSSYPVRLRARGFSLARLSWHGAKPVVRKPAGGDGWVEVDVELENIDEAAAAVGASAPDVVVVRPVALRRRVAELSRTLARRNAAG
jgi:predicted DNA-binding transcriptional regulator YafY